MSDTSQGPGWWLASDGKWYPPEAWTGPPRQSDATWMSAGQTQPTSAPTGYPPTPTYGPQPYPAYGAYQGAPFVQPRPTNGLAVASLVCACVGVVPFFFGLPCVLGIIFGFVSRAQIRRSNDVQQGGGMALAGIIVGFSLIAVFILVVILIAAFGHSTCDSNLQYCSVN